MLNTQAPNFCAKAYLSGGAQEVCLSAHRGHWLIILFYGSDFSFV